MDSIDVLSERMKKLSESVESMKAFGISDKILISWLCFNLKISKAKAKQFIDSYQAFYDELIKHKLTESLE